jgi:hypothetical protein
MGLGLGLGSRLMLKIEIRVRIGVGRQGLIGLVQIISFSLSPTSVETL